MSARREPHDRHCVSLGCEGQPATHEAEIYDGESTEPTIAPYCAECADTLMRGGEAVWPIEGLANRLVSCRPAAWRDRRAEYKRLRAAGFSRIKSWQFASWLVEVPDDL